MKVRKNTKKNPSEKALFCVFSCFIRSLAIFRNPQNRGMDIACFPYPTNPYERSAILPDRQPKITGTEHQSPTAAFRNRRTVYFQGRTAEHHQLQLSR